MFLDELPSGGKVWCLSSRKVLLTIDSPSYNVTSNGGKCCIHGERGRAM